MKNFRIFIENLPNTATESIVRSEFQQFVNVKSVEIKERKNATHKHTSCFFSYVNVETDENGLHRCFQRFNNDSWLGQHVPVKIAKESFLEKLQREREDKYKDTNLQRQVDHVDTESAPLDLDGVEKRRQISEPPEHDARVAKEPIDIRINDNKRVKIGDRLRIEGAGKEVIHTIVLNRQKKSKSLDKFRTRADCKRIESLMEKKKTFKSQKDAIRAALFYANVNKSNKTVFDADGFEDENSSKLNLFDDGMDSEEGNLSDILTNEEKFKGTSGEKLMKLQARFKNDSRFKLDEKFLEEEEGKHDGFEDENDLDTEKNKQLEILSEILGREIRSKKPHSHKKDYDKVMRRFDPSKSDHAMYEKVPGIEEKQTESLNEISETIPEVSKEIFYKLDENSIKEALKVDKGFSLLKMFGENNTLESEDNYAETGMNSTKRIGSFQDNPFKFDSSDDEDQTEHLKVAKRVPNKVWNEPFFFQEDDYRFQDGVDFVQKIASRDQSLDSTEENFDKLRRNLKEIVKTKMRNNLRKHKMFKKKLGGGGRGSSSKSKNKKSKRVEKALKR